MRHCPTCGRHYASDVSVCPEDGTVLQADATVAVQIPIDPLIGRVLDDKYRLEERLGMGGMGAVYRATHLLIDRPVAVKVLNTRFVEDEAAKHRFRREARAAGRLQHPNAVAVTDFGTTPDGLVYIVMELLEGRSLRDVLALEAPLEIARAVSLMVQISAAVEAAHESGIIHRDLKPGNIFLVQRKHAAPVIKVLDFGIAKLAEEATEDADAHNLTQTGVMIGTPRYMSPEQCDGAKLTPASDVYSLGIVFYEMLTGSTPFTGTSPLAVALQHSSKQPRRPSELNALIPPALEEVVLHTLNKRPEERPADAGAFRSELLAAAQSIGLESANGFNASGTATPHNAKTETGPVVFDLEQMRERQNVNALAGETTMLVDTDEVSQVLIDNSPGHTGATAPVAQGFTRVNVPLRRKQAWSRGLLVIIALASLVIGVSIFAILRMKTNSVVLPVSNTNVTVNASPTPTESAATPSPTASPASTEEGGGEKRQSEKRSNRANQQRKEGAKKPSKIGSVLNKVKRIFKNPF